MLQPSIILVRPQMGENIGAAARAMANFGLGELRLVAPRDGWPNPKASDTAGRALNIIDDTAVHGDVKAALADCQFVLATTARERAMSLPVLEVREAMQMLYARLTCGQRCAILFGPERTGLENEDMALADAVVTIPVAPEYASLNVGQAVVVCAYEWFMVNREHSGFAIQGSHGAEEGAMPHSAHILTPFLQGEGLSVAPREKLEGLLGQLEEALDAENFWRVAAKKETMWRNIRATLVRAGLTEQEIATWRGMLKALRGL